MRTLLERLLSLFLPPRGAHRAESVPAQADALPAPPHPADVVFADDLPLVRPYVIHWEQQRRAAVSV